MRSPLKRSVLTGVLAALLAATGLYLHDRRTGAEAARLRSENQRLLAALGPTGVTSAPAAQEAGAPDRERAASRPDVPRPAVIPGPYRDEGQSTPQATLQTIAWALDSADLERVKDLVMFENPSAREKVVAMLQSLPPESRALWPTPEDIAASVMISDGIHRPYPAASILQLSEVETLAPDRARLRLPGSRLDGGIYQKAGNGWRFVILEKAIDAYLAQHARAKPAP